MPRRITAKLRSAGDSQSFILSRVAVYINRFLVSDIALGKPLLKTIHWLVGREGVEQDLMPLASLVNSGKRRGPFYRKKAEDIEDGDDFADCFQSALRSLPKTEHQCVVDLLRGLVQKRADQFSRPKKTSLENNIKCVQRTFGLSDLATEAYLLLFIGEVRPIISGIFENIQMSVTDTDKIHLMAIALGCSVHDLNEVFNGKLMTSGLVEISGYHEFLSLNDDFVHLRRNTSDENFETTFFRQINPDPIPLESHVIEPEITKHLLNLLGAKPLSSTHVILHGPPGTGNTTSRYLD